MSSPHVNQERYARLATIARDPQTAAIYQARCELAAQYSIRDILAQTNGMMFGRYISTERRYGTARFMSEVR